MLLASWMSQTIRFPDVLLDSGGGIRIECLVYLLTSAPIKFQPQVCITVCVCMRERMFNLQTSIVDLSKQWGVYSH